LWRFHLLPLDVDLAAPAGSAVVLSAIMGIPFVRLRSALPDEFSSVPVGATFGRRTSLSLRGLAEQAPRVRVLLQSDSGNATGGSPMKRVTSFSDAESGAKTQRVRRALVERLSAIRSDVVDDATAQQHDRLEELIGTALVLAFLQTAQFMPTVEHARRLAAATRYFENVRTPFGWGFRDVHTKLLVCLGPGVLDSRENWWCKARVLRLVLSQSPAGYWDANNTSALSLHARPRCEVLALRGGLMEELLASPLVMAAAGLLGFGGHDHHAEDRGNGDDGAGSDASAPNETSVLDHDGELNEDKAQQAARDQDSHRKPAVDALCWTRVLDNDVFDGAADGAIGRSSDDGITIAACDSREVLVQPDVANGVTFALQQRLPLTTLSRRRSASADDVAVSAAHQQRDTAAEGRASWHAPRKAIPHTPLPSGDPGAQSPASRRYDLLAGPAASRAANLLAWAPMLFRRVDLLFHEAAVAPSIPVKRRESASGRLLPKTPMQKRLEGWASSLEDEKQTAVRYADVTSAAQQANDGREIAGHHGSPLQVAAAAHSHVHDALPLHQT